MKRTCLLLALFPTLVLAEQTGFIEDSHVTTTLRMDYIDLHSNGFGSEAIGFSDYDMGTWAQSVKVAYASGFFLDHFGLDLDLYANDPIGTQGEGFTTREVVKADANGEAVGMSKIPQLYLKQKFNFGDTELQIFEGRRVLREYGGTSAEDNASNSSYDSISTEINNENLILKLGYLVNYTDSDESTSHDFETPDGEPIDFIATADITLKSEQDLIRYYYTQSQNYMSKQQLRYARSFGMSPDAFLSPGRFTVTATYQKALDNYLSMSDSNRMFDDYALMGEANLEFFLNHGFLKFSYNYTDASSAGSLGKFDLNMASGVQGSQDTITSGNAWDYNNDKEHAFGIQYFHDVGSDFTFGIDARGGFFDYQQDTIVQGEVSLVSLWHPARISGLSISFVAARDQSFKQGFDNTPYMVDGKFQVSNGHAFVSTIAYNF